MNIQSTIEALKKNRYTVSFFNTSEEAADYLDKKLDNFTIGFGDSKTMSHMSLY